MVKKEALLNILYLMVKGRDQFYDCYENYLADKSRWSLEEIVFWWVFSSSKMVASWNMDSWPERFAYWQSELERQKITQPALNELRRAIATGDLKAREVAGVPFVQQRDAMYWLVCQWLLKDLPRPKRTAKATAARIERSRDYAKRFYAKKDKNPGRKPSFVAGLVLQDLTRLGKAPRYVKSIVNAAKKHPPDGKTVVKP